VGGASRQNPKPYEQKPDFDKTILEAFVNASPIRSCCHHYTIDLDKNTSENIATYAKTASSMRLSCTFDSFVGQKCPTRIQNPVLKAYTFRCGRPLGIFWEILHLTHNPQRMFRNSESAFNLSNS